MKLDNSWRIKFLFVSLLFLAVLFSWRLFFLQIVKGEEYAERVDRQYLRSARTFFNRGSIFFSAKNGNLVPAATLRQEFILTINPRQINNPEKVLELLEEIVDIDDKEEFVKRANRKESAYEEIIYSLTEAEAEEIGQMNIKGVYLFKEKKRFYPGDSLGSHVIGFMAFQDQEYAGRYGLEKYYQNVLSRQDTGSFNSFFAEVFLNKEIPEEVESDKQGDIILTIEPTIQGQLENRLSELVDRYSAEEAGAIVMDPRTGAIIAMASNPDFSPGGRVTDISVLPNPLVERVFEMGSVIKPLTLAAGFNEGIINSNSTYYDAGEIVINNRRIMNHDKKVRGVVDMQTVIDQSLNTGAIYVMRLVGMDKFRDYMLNRYGLGEESGIDLPDEIRSLTGNLSSNREVEYATASFGQGIALTPIATIRAFAVLANGGYLVKPHVVKAVRTINEGVRESTPYLGKKVLDVKATDEITTMLIKAVDESLLGGGIKLPHHTVAGKTGTAQMPSKTGKGYDPDRYLHSYFGYYPAYEPRFITLFYLINPKDVRFASDSIAPVFMDFAQFIINYYELPPDRKN